MSAQTDTLQAILAEHWLISGYGHFACTNPECDWSFDYKPNLEELRSPVGRPRLEFAKHQADVLKKMGWTQRSTETAGVVDKLLNIGDENQLGGDGEAIGVVVVYKSGAFVNASWGGTAEDRLAALVEAAAAEGIKKL